MDSPFRKKELVKKHRPRPFKYLTEIEITSLIYKNSDKMDIR